MKGILCQEFERAKLSCHVPAGSQSHDEGGATIMTRYLASVPPEYVGWPKNESEP